MESLARKYSHQEIQPAHLLWNLLSQPDGVTPALLRKLGVDPAASLSDLEGLLGQLPKVEDVSQQFLGAELKKVFEGAEGEAKQLKDDYVSTEHLLLAIVEEAKSSLGDFSPQTGNPPRLDFEVFGGSARSATSDRPKSRREISGFGEIWSRPHGTG